MMAEAELIRCAACGTANRVPRDKLAQGLLPKCGRCGGSLVQPAGPLTVSDASFAADVEHSTLPVLLDAWAPWCGPCRMIAPVVEELARELAGRIRVAKLNVDENPVTAQRFTLRNIPTLLVPQNEREVDRIVGAQPKAAILRHLQRFGA